MLGWTLPRCRTDVAPRKRSVFLLDQHRIELAAPLDRLAGDTAQAREATKVEFNHGGHAVTEGGSGNRLEAKKGRGIVAKPGKRDKPKRLPESPDCEGRPLPAWRPVRQLAADAVRSPAKSW